jgi:oligosaccharide repeat unit polymerase
MLISASALLLLVLFLVPFLVREPEDPMSPIRIVALRHIVTIVPYLLIIAWDTSVIHPAVFIWIARDVTGAVLYYCAVQALAFAALLAGYYAGRATTTPTAVRLRDFRISSRWTAVAIAITAGAGFAAFAVKLRLAGGMEYVLDNLADRTKLQEGLGYLSTIAHVLIALAFLLAVYRLRFSRSLAAWAVVALLFVAAAGALSLFGGRKDSVYLVLMAVIVWHYCVRRFERVPVVLGAWLGAGIALYAMAVLLLRQRGAVAEYLYRPAQFLPDVWERLGHFFVNISYVENYLFVLAYFSPAKLWYGASYRDLLTAPIPRGMYEAKPPVDEGGYLATLADGGQAFPPTPWSQLVGYSWPAETLGAAYMNFWVPGVLVLGFALGWIYSWCGRLMKSSGYSFLSVYIGGYLVLNFHFSNLRIVQIATIVPTVLAALWLIGRLPVALARR